MSRHPRTPPRSEHDRYGIEDDPARCQRRSAAAADCWSGLNDVTLFS